MQEKSKISAKLYECVIKRGYKAIIKWSYVNYIVKIFSALYNNKYVGKI